MEVEQLSQEDLDAGWSSSDWFSGRWRMQFSRRLTPKESDLVSLGANSTYEEDGYSLAKMINLIKGATAEGAEIHLVRARLDGVTAIEIKDDWEPVFPAQDLIIQAPVEQ